MLNGSNTRLPPPQEPQEPPTIEGLQKQLARAQQYLELFRQQRDRAVAMANDLQIELALVQHQIGELESEAAKRPEPSIQPPMLTDSPE